MILIDINIDMHNNMFQITYMVRPRIVKVRIAEATLLAFTILGDINSWQIEGNSRLSIQHLLNSISQNTIYYLLNSVSYNTIYYLLNSVSQNTIYYLLNSVSQNTIGYLLNSVSQNTIYYLLNSVSQNTIYYLLYNSVSQNTNRLSS